MTECSSFCHTGVITGVYEDLGPCLRVSLQLDVGGIVSFEAYELPVTEEWLRRNVGTRVTITSSTELYAEKPK